VPDFSQIIKSIPMSSIELDGSIFRLRSVGDVQELMQSLIEHGQYVPVIVCNKKDNVYQMIAGFRRAQALRELGAPSILARVFEDISNDDAIRIAILDNLYHENLKFVELDEFSKQLRTQNLVSEVLYPFIDSILDDLNGRSQERKATSALAKDTADDMLPWAELEEKDDGAVYEDREGGDGDVVYLEDLVPQTLEKLESATEYLEQTQEFWEEIEEQDKADIRAQCQYISDVLGYLKDK